MTWFQGYSRGWVIFFLVFSGSVLRILVKQCQHLYLQHAVVTYGVLLFRGLCRTVAFFQAV